MAMTFLYPKQMYMKRTNFMRKIFLILVSLLFVGCSTKKSNEILGPGCECYLNFGENWTEIEFDEEYVSEDGESIPKDYRILGDKTTCLTMWNKEKKMLLILSEFSDEDTMKLDDDDILKVIRKNLELEYRSLGYVLKEESEYNFLDRNFFVLIAERSVNGDFQVSLIEITGNSCTIIEISGQNVDQIFTELNKLQMFNQ